MVKYLSGRVPKNPQDKITDDRYQYLGLEQAEPNLGDPNVISVHTPSAATYDPNTGVLTLTVNDHKFFNGDTIKIADNSLSFSCNYGSGEHTYNGGTSSNAVTVTGGSNYDVTDAIYDPIAGIATLTIGSHTLPVPTTHQAESGTSYNPTTGIMTLKITGHNFSNDDWVYLNDGAVTFKCQYGVGSAHTWVGGTSTNAITITAGSVQKDVTNAVYDPDTGLCVMTIGSHSFTTSDTVTIGANKLSFTCTADGDTATKTYPRSTDPAYNTAIAIDAVDQSGGTITCNVGAVSGNVTTAYPRSTDPISNRWVKISNVQTDTFDIQVLNTIPSTNTSTHTYVTSAPNSIKHAETTITIGANKLSFTCTADNNQTSHTYPRTTDPYYNTPIAVSETTGTTVTAYVGPASGGQTKTYPRSTDPISGKFVKISGVTANTFSLQILDNVPSTNVNPHVFVGSSNNSIQRRSKYTGINNEAPPIGNQYQIVSVPGHPGRRYWVPKGGGLVPGAISIYDEGTLVGTADSITQLNFVGAAVTAAAQPLGIAATMTIIPATVQDDPPLSPKTGELWWESDTGDLFIYYDDGTSAQWVLANAGGLGNTGDKGNKGDIGPSGGQKGQKGEQNDKGQKGEEGEKGDLGQKGSAGDVEAQGNKGQKGQQGDKGIKGQKGEVGEKGQKGQKGEVGDKGIKGNVEEKGNKGQKGEVGDKGQKGQQGDKGNKGQKGELGIKGQKGQQGDKGIKGQQGDKGIKGIKGQKGEVGDKGQKGESVKGQKGQDGAVAEKGQKGEKGIKGQKGQDGNKGQKGDVEAQGNKGQKGDSIKGQKGESVKGQKGQKGQKGEKGLKGSGQTISISTTPPGSAAAGDLWWDSDDSDLHVYYDDGDSSQWVSITTSGALKGEKGQKGGGASGHHNGFVSKWHIPMGF